MDKDKSGVVDYTEFCEVLQVDPAPLCERTFGLYDYDKTGQIDAREVRQRQKGASFYVAYIHVIYIFTHYFMLCLLLI